MKQILCFGDSNTFGSDPGPEGFRHPYHLRWPGIVQQLLGEEFYVIEEGMGGRTTVFSDPLEPMRCGISYLPVALQSHQPLDLVILSLGTNDCKGMFSASPRVIAAGMERLVQTVQRFPFGGQTKPPKILIVSPIHMGKEMEQCPFASLDEESARKVEQLAPLYKQVAEQHGCAFLDASMVAKPGCDQIHMDADSHAALAKEIANKIKELF